VTHAGAVANPSTPHRLLDLHGCTVAIEPDWLFQQMAAAGQGWYIRNEHGQQRQVLSDLDLAVLNAARGSAQRHGRLVIGVNRVVVGIVLAPVIYAVLRTLLQTGRPDELLPNDPLAIPPGQKILVASRSHAIRDLLAESVISFNRRETRLVQFPTYRLARDGALVPGAFGRLPKMQRPRASEMLTNAAPIVVYDYWPLPPGFHLSNIAAVFAELNEHDGLDAVERIHEVIEHMDAGFAVAIVNVNDIAKRERLAALGFEFIAAQTYAEPESGELSSTFTGIDRVAPKMHQVTFQCLPDDTPVAAPLAEVFKLLAEVNARLLPQDPYPLPLSRAWYVLDQLGSCPSSLQRYEQLRRLDPYSQSLGFRIDGLDNVNWNLVPDRVRGSLQTRWPQVIELFRRAYALLLQSNPKWWALAELVVDAKTPMAVILSNRLAARALREELLLEFGWSEAASPVQIRALSEARRNDERFNRVVVLKQWSDRQRGTLFSLMPRELLVIGYSFEGPVLSKRLQAMQKDFDVTIPLATLTSLTRLLGARARPAEPRPGSAVVWDSDALALVGRLARRHWAHADSSDGVTEDDILFERAATRLPTSPAPSDDLGDELLEIVTLTFIDGRELVVPADRELLVLPSGGGSTEQRFPSDVRVGDRVLLLSADEQADLFATALVRTGHLIPSDTRILGRWREALVALRHAYPPATRGAASRFVDAMRQAGCPRDNVTIRSWLRGSTMAPREPADIAKVLLLAGGIPDVDTWAGLIDREMNVVRDFHRRIGRRIARRLVLAREQERSSDRVDQEIDELLEQTELRTLLRVGPVETRPKSAVVTMAVEEEDA
jgi:hypothetical protein